MGFQRFEDLSKNNFTFEEDDSENGDLPETLEDNELPHLGCDQAFSL